ncbi:hypothetical protein JXA56_00655 [Candidatus Micrarchaeota archaeon]|nr:hypothetical protein [Candidatus Micrarchaeota archaeon]
MSEFPGVEIAVIVVSASIVFAGILLGLGKAFGYKRIEDFGVEELIQSIINAAIIGAFAAIIELVGAVSSTIVTPTCEQGNVVQQLICVLGHINDGLFLMFQNLVQILNLLGYYQSLALDFGAFAITPFANLDAVSAVLSVQLLSLNAIIVLLALNIQIVVFIAGNALGLLFPVGLVLRTMFATRKVGGFLIALAVGLYIFYPTFVLIFPDPQIEINQSAIIMENFTNNSFYATPPIIDLNNNYAIAAKFDILSGRCHPDMFNTTSTNLTNTTINISNSSILMACNQTLADYNITNLTAQNVSIDFTGDLTEITQSNNTAISKSLLYAVVAPLFSLLVTIVFVKELASLLGSEIGLKTIASI